MISVVIPVYNEEEILTSSVEKLRGYLDHRKLDYEILLVDNGSSDRTAEVGRLLAHPKSPVRFYTLPERGVGHAFALGVRESKSDFIVSLDLDLSSELLFLDYAHNLLQYCDMLVGSKMMGSQRRSLARAFGSQLYIHFTQLLFGLTTSDYSIGSKAYRKSSILEALPHLDRWTGYVLELCLYLRLKGKRIIQVGIDCDDQRKSHFNLIYEGVYRYTHLLRCWNRLKSRESWFHQAR